MQATARPTGQSTALGSVLVLLCVAQFMVLLDASIVNVALPSIRADLGFSESGLQWVINAYTLPYAGFLLLGGRVADFFGVKRLFQVGIALFAAASLLGGLAPDEATLLVARAFQGFGGALLSPAILTLLTTTFADPQARARAMGAWSAAAGAGFASGALIGGVLTEYANWRWTLIINVPIGVAGMLAARRILPEVIQPKRPRLDVLGALLATAGLLSIVYGTVNSGPDGWSAAATWGPIAAGAVLICWFIVHEAVVDQPLMPMSLLRSRPIATANATMFLLSAAVYPSMFILSVYAQNVLHYSPFKTGLVFLAPTIVMAIASKYAATVMRRTGSRPLLIIAAPVSAAGLAWLSRAGVDSSLVGSVLAPATVTFLGLGLANPPLAMAATAGAPPGQAGLASGIVNTTRQLGITIGLAIVVTVAVDQTRSSAAVGPLRSLANGYDAALVVAAVFAFVALATALAFPRAARPALVQKKVLSRPSTESDRYSGAASRGEESEFSDDR